MRGGPGAVIHFLPVFSILAPCPSVFGSLQTLLAPTWNLGLKRPAAAGRPLAVAQRFALEKQTQTCDAVLALWTASKQPNSPLIKHPQLSVKTEALFRSIKRFHLDFLDLSNSSRLKALEFGGKLLTS